MADLTQDSDETVAAVCRCPRLRGINLEDLAAPRCFEIERSLRRAPTFPVLPRRSARYGRCRARRAHQRTRAWVEKKLVDVQIVVAGAGGTAVVRLLRERSPQPPVFDLYGLFMQDEQTSTRHG